MENEQEIRQNWTLKRDEDGILWLRLDRAGASINTLSRGVLDELGAVLDDLLRHPPTGLIICSGKKSEGGDYMRATQQRAEVDHHSVALLEMD